MGTPPGPGHNRRDHQPGPVAHELPGHGAAFDPAPGLRQRRGTQAELMPLLRRALHEARTSRGELRTWVRAAHGVPADRPRSASRSWRNSANVAENSGGLACALRRKVATNATAAPR